MPSKFIGKMMKKVMPRAKKTGKKTPARKKAVKRKPSRKKVVKKTRKKTVRAKRMKKPRKTARKKPVRKKAKKKPKKAVKKRAKKKAVRKKAVRKKPVKKPKKPTKKAKKRVRRTFPERTLYPLRTIDPRKRPWEPEHSKILAAIINGLSPNYLNIRRLLYIGAAHGYTISHIFQQPLEIYAIEKSPEMMRHFLPLAEDLPNVLPIMMDAACPDAYANLIPNNVDVVFQDIAQKDQVGIFLLNCERFLSRQGVGMLCLKAPAVASVEAATVFADAREQLEDGGGTVIQEINLEPYQTGHRLFLIHMNPYVEY